MRQRKSTTFYCFSPPVMLATFVIELVLAVWALWRYKHTAIVKVVVGILCCLAFFQMAEFNICAVRFGMSSITWARLGYVAITALPVMGIHALMIMAGVARRFRWFIGLSYGVMLLFMVYFLFSSQGLTAAACGGNYVIFTTSVLGTSWYGLYYYGFEWLGLFMAVVLARRTVEVRTKQALYGFIASYLILFIPVGTANVINPKLVQAIPSIMCGFAVFLALTITLYVLPRVADKREHIDKLAP